MYIIGIDVGGTNTDAALIKGDEVVAMAKTPTRHADLFASTSTALEEVLRHCQGQEPLRLHLSTTLSTNLIVEGKGVPTVVVAIPGPGVNLASYQFPFPLIELDGYIDHRGREVSPLDAGEIEELKARIPKDCRALAVVGKFSHRNPSHEQQVATALSQWFSGVISCGHRLAGRANFPRRIVTAYLNSSVAKQQLEFTVMWRRLREQLPVPLEEIVILKADGGTMTLADSEERPVETILSGPAASIMGVQALTSCAKPNYVIVDIGGTTTDLAAVVEGKVLIARDGATIAGNKTLVPALLTRSVGLGGDSELNYDRERGTFHIGPQRAGTPVCLGGEKLTPTDAAVALGMAEIGEKERAVNAWHIWAEGLGLTWQELAQKVIDAFTAQLAEAIEDLYSGLENVPLYTVSEILMPPKVRPEAVVGLGAPAEVFIPRLGGILGLEWEIVPFAAGANAVGAAAARTTLSLTLHADTELGIVTIPELGVREKLASPISFDLHQARQMAEEKLRELAVQAGYSSEQEVYIVEEESFPLVRGFRTVGRIHMIRTQLRPGVRRIRGGGNG